MLVVFYDPEGAIWEWALKPGFRHVFVCVDDGENWILIDGRDGRPIFQNIQTSRFDLKGHFEQQGYTVVEAEQGSKPLRTPFVLVNCVGLVKAVLCIRAPFAVTPYQLYRHLTKEPR